MTLAECYKRYHADELRWDWHTNIGNGPRAVLEAALARRGVPTCGEMRRRGGPFVPNSRYTGHCPGCQRSTNASIDRGKCITFFKVNGEKKS